MPTLVEEIENALRIDIASAANLPVPESRRLTGPGMLSDQPGAVLDVFYQDFSNTRIGVLWQKHARAVLDAIGWRDEDIYVRHFTGGSNLAISAPMDLLYSAVFAVETAWSFCAAELLEKPAGDFAAMTNALKGVMAREANPQLIDLINAAEAAHIDVLCDDDEISIGHGIGSKTFAADQLPDSDAVNWGELHDIPVALITGTNGKTTTTRLCAAIARAAGKVSGLTSTDQVRVGDDILERGDFSGPGGARLLLRDKRLEIAFLEVARGGILRRGLAVRHAKVAAVLNVAADHLGDYGVNTIEELAEAKFAVHRALLAEGVLILNADDALVVAQAARTEGRFCWFSLNQHAEQIRTARAAGHCCAWVESGTIIYFDGIRQTRVIAVDKIPITLQGQARYNISNAVAAVCITRALSIDFDVIRTGLANFQNDTTDNPGRLNEFKVKGARVFVDFAHNPHSIEAVTSALKSVESTRRFVMISNAGDRSDEAIRDLTSGALSLKPQYVVAAELPDYLRGREPGEVSQLIKSESIALGVPQDHILLASSPLAGARTIVDLLMPGDLVLLLVHSERDAIFKMLKDAS
ncbi:MAG: Mur ligase family protein [Rhizobiaceae bacterium]